jgi:hypothetical protein
MRSVFTLVCESEDDEAEVEVAVVDTSAAAE